MSRRTLSIAAIVVVVAGVFAAGLAVSGNGTSSLHASPINPSLPAPATAGRDSTGQLVSVPEGGRPALVTFFYAHCLTTCPIIAGEIAAALNEVGPATTSGIDVVAISVDPQGDTPAEVNHFLAVHDLSGRMNYIIGTRSQLSPLWQAWNVSVKPGAEIYVPAMSPSCTCTGRDRSTMVYMINEQVRDGTCHGSPRSSQWQTSPRTSGLWSIVDMG